MLLRGNTHAFDQRHSLLQREPLGFLVMRNLRQALADEFHAAAVEQRSVSRRGHQHSPAAVIGDADDCAIV